MAGVSQAALRVGFASGGSSFLMPSMKAVVGVWPFMPRPEATEFNALARRNAHRTGRADFPHPALRLASPRGTRRAATKLGQAYESEVLVKVREWISSALAPPDLVLEAQPPAQPHSRVVVEHPIRFAGGSNAKVVGPSAERLVQLIHQPCGLLPSTRSVGQRVDSFDHALDALL